MSKSPAFQFYPADYSQDVNVRLMNYEQRGIYIELMGICWIEGSIPADEKLLARLLGLEVEHFLEQWEWIKKCFCHKSDNFLTHPRLEKEKQKQKSYSKNKSEAGKKGAEKRWGKEVESYSTCHSSAIDLPLAKNSFSSSISSSKTISKDIVTPSQKKYKFEDKHHVVAKELSEIILEKYPHYSKKPPDLDAWANDIRLLEGEGFTIAQIEDVAAWAIYQSDFWSKQIRSAGNLRKHFRKLIDQSGLYEKWSKQNGH